MIRLPLPSLNPQPGGLPVLNTLSIESGEHIIQ